MKKFLWRASSGKTLAELNAEAEVTLVVRITRYGGKLRVHAAAFCHGVSLRCGMDRQGKR